MSTEHLPAVVVHALEAVADDVLDASPLDALSPRHRLFTIALVGDRAKGNATVAARLAGYADPRRSGSEIMARDDVARAVDFLVDQLVGSEYEWLGRLAMHARTSIADLATCFHTVQRDGRDYREFDIEKAAELGLDGAIKSVKPTRYGDHVELYCQQAAITLLGKWKGLWTDKLKVEANIDLTTLSEAELDRIVKYGRL